MNKTKIFTGLILVFTLMCITPIFMQNASAAVYDSFTYRINDGDTISILDYPTSKSGALEIPNEIAGMPVVSIEDGAFEGCNKLTSVKIPANINYIGTRAFNAEGLLEIMVSDMNSNYCAISGVLFSKDTTTLVQYPIGREDITYEIPQHVSTIGKYAFANGENLTEITVPGTVKTIDDGTFSECTNLLTIGFEDGLEQINAEAFYGCKKLTEFVLPDSLTYIGDRCFQNCSGLLTMGIPSRVWYVGTSAFENCTKLASVVLPSQLLTLNPRTFFKCSALTDVDLPYNVTKIGESAFENCSNLTKAIVRENVNTIEDRAFYGCSKLNTVDIHPGTTKLGKQVFYNCKGLINVTLPLSIQEIGEEAFLGCSGLTDVDIPKGIQTIHDRAFKNCTALGKILLPDTITNIGEEAFYNCAKLAKITLSAGLSEIKPSTFFGCKALTTIIIPSTVKTIGDMAFKNCAKLYEVQMSNNISFIGEEAFYGCALLSVISLPGTTESIGTKAFYGCKSLLYMTIPQLITEIKPETFSGCSGLVDVSLPEGLTTIGEEAFYACKALKNINFPETLTILGNAAFYNASSLQEIILPDNLTTIPAKAFYGCKLLTSLKLPENIDSLGTQAFYGCAALSSLRIPGSLTEIGDSAFYNCKMLKVLTLEEGIETILKQAFYNCNSLTDIVIPTTVKKIGDKAFYGCKSMYSAMFAGNAPTTFGRSVFYGYPDEGEKAFSIYIYSTSTGFSTPEWNGYPCRVVVITEIIVQPPNKIDYVEGESLDTEGMIVTVVYDNGSTLPVTSYSISGFESLTLGTKTVTVTYAGFTDTFEVVVRKRNLSNITVSPPHKLSYLEGENLDTTGMIVYAHYDNGSTEEVKTGYELRGYTSTPGIKTITISYNGLFTTFNVSVAPKNLAYISVYPPTKLTYKEDDKLDLTGMRVMAVYTNGTNELITSNYSVSECEMTAGTHTITVTYAGYSDTFDIYVSAKSFTTIRIEPPTKLEYIEGQELDLTGLKVIAIYSTGLESPVDVYEISGFDSTPGTKTITVTYSGMSKTFDVIVIPKTLLGIEVTPPYTLTYILGDIFDSNGLKVEAVYDNGINEDVTVFAEISEVDDTKVGIQTVTVTYEGFTHKFQIEIVDESLEGITVTPPTKLEYIEGEEFDPSGMIVTAYFADGKSNVVDVYEVRGFSKAVGTHLIVVSYAGFSQSFEVTVTQDKTKFEILEPHIDYAAKKNDMVTVMASVTNNRDYMIPGTLIVGVYNSSHQLVDIKYQKLNIEVTGAEQTFILNVPLDLEIDGSYAKAFIWSNFDDMTTLSLPTFRMLTD